MRKYGLIFLLTIFAWSSLSIETKAQKGPQLLFVQSAGSFAFDDGTLTLRQIAPSTIFFSERPKRIAGHVRNDLFLKLWVEGKNSFKKDPPNATLSMFGPDGKASQAVVVLSNPRVDASNLIYDAKVLEGKIPQEGAESTLFIDGDNAPCSESDPGTAAGDDLAFSSYPCRADNAFSEDE